MTHHKPSETITTLSAVMQKRVFRENWIIMTQKNIRYAVATVKCWRGRYCYHSLSHSHTAQKINVFVSAHLINRLAKQTRETVCEASPKA